MKIKNDSFYYKVFNDIRRGSSQIEIFGESFFVKHPLISDLVEMEAVKIKSLERCIKKGILTREEFIQKMKDDGIYPYDIEKEIEDIEYQINSTEIFIKTQIKKIIKEREKIKIKRLQEKAAELTAEFESLIIDDNADSISEKKSHEYLISNSIFLNENLKDLAFSDWSILNDFQINEIYNQYSLHGTDVSAESIEGLVVRDFFKPYHAFCESSQDFFGKPAIDLSRNQMSLIHLAKLFKNIFKNFADKIPESIKEDPKAIIEHVEGVSTQEESMQKSDERAEKSGSNFNVSTKFGARKQDYKDAGIEGKFMDLTKLTEGGKTLNTEEVVQAFAKQAGIK